MQYMGVVAVRGRSGVVKAKAAVGMSWQLESAVPHSLFSSHAGYLKNEILVKVQCIFMIKGQKDAPISFLISS
jgi:hypothetical protein